MPTPDESAAGESPSPPHAPRTTTPRVLLDPTSATSCPVKTQNLFDPTIGTPPPPDLDAKHEEIRRLIAASRSHRGWVLGGLAELHGDAVVDLRGVAHDLAVERTLGAIHRGALAILSPGVPDDLVGHRRGRPDLIVRIGERSDGQPAYAPVGVHNHKVRQARTPDIGCRVSALSHPSPTDAKTQWGWSVRRSREDDLLPLVHLWWLLDAAGWTRGAAPVIGLIGTDTPLVGRGPEVVWVDPAERLLPTYSRRHADHMVLRSPLERYEHEFGFRLKVARTAAERTGQPDDPPPMVNPIVMRECDCCRWWPLCEQRLDDRDLSVAIDKNRLDVKEIATLRGLGIRTVDELVAADLDELLPVYLPEVGHHTTADRRIRTAVHRSRLLQRGVELERITTGPIDVPTSEFEIDLDLETTADNRVYLWGILVDDRTPGSDAASSTPSYKAFSRFADIDPRRELDLARAALTWLGDTLDDHPDAFVYHYSGFEPHHIRLLADAAGDPALVALSEHILTRFVDLFTLMRANFFGTHGLGLKKVATAGAGFSWRDDDPGGLNSQLWFAEAVHGPNAATRAAATQRVLDYNEDDVRATRALRDWLRTEHGPGTRAGRAL